MIDDNDILEQASTRIVDMLQKQFRQGTLGEGVWKSIEHIPGMFVAVVRLPTRFVALDIYIKIDEEWTEHLVNDKT